MQTIKLRAQVDSDGHLRLDLPVNLISREVEVLVVMQPIEVEEVDDFGWPIGFFDRTYGALADDPIERGSIDE